MNRLFTGSELAAERGPAIRLLLGSVAETAPVLVSGYAVSKALDEGFLAHRPAVGFCWLLSALAALALRVLANAYSVRYQAEVSEAIRHLATVKVVTAAVSGAVANGGDRTRHDVVAKLVSQVESLRRLAGALLISGLNATLSLVSAMAGLALLNVTAFVLCLPLTIGAVALLRWQVRPLAAVNDRVLGTDETLSRLTGAVTESLRDVLAAGATERAKRDLHGAVADNASVLRDLARSGVARGLVVAVGGYGPLLLVLLLAPSLTSAGTLSAGGVVGLVTYVNAGLVPGLRALSQSASSTAAPLGAAMRRLSSWSTAGGAPAAATGVRVPRRGDVRLEEAGFGYRPDAAPVLYGLTLDIPYGTHLAVVGTSGAGKSTVAHLIAGLLRPTTGSVTLGGVPLAELDSSRLRKEIAVVPQEPYIFAGRVRENLRYLAPGADDEQVWRAVHAVGATETVTRLGGLDAEISRQGLAPGEQQILVLARIYLSEASVIILDEATSNVAPDVEETAEAAFRERPGTLLVIAHRISSALRADSILVIDASATTAGSHDHLMAVSPRYAELVGNWDPEAEPAATADGGGSVPTAV
ncbi:ABC transporter ATP-binding protein [Streptomyces sp. PA03-3a]|nr:ABC transporter ATP-binding protein [Streptomyces sp. PA03-3a]